MFSHLAIEVLWNIIILHFIHVNVNLTSKIPNKYDVVKTSYQSTRPDMLSIKSAAHPFQQSYHIYSCHISINIGAQIASNYGIVLKHPNLQKIDVTMRQLLQSTLAATWILQIAILTNAVPHTYHQHEKDDDKALYDPNLFEGDIEITQEQFERFYGQPKQDTSRTVSIWVLTLDQSRIYHVARVSCGILGLMEETVIL